MDEQLKLAKTLAQARPGQETCVQGYDSVAQPGVHHHRHSRPGCTDE